MREFPKSNTARDRAVWSATKRVSDYVQHEVEKTRLLSLASALRACRLHGRLAIGRLNRPCGSRAVGSRKKVVSPSVE
jgi:hypothetical protein